MDGKKVAKELLRIAKLVMEPDISVENEKMTKEEFLEAVKKQIKKITLEVSFDNDTSSFRASKKNRFAEQEEIKDEEKQEEKPKPLTKKEQERQKLNEITQEWRKLQKAAEAFTGETQTTPFWGNLMEDVLKQKSIPMNVVRRYPLEKNFPQQYAGIENDNDYRKFLLKQIQNNGLTFELCIMHPSKYTMPLDIYTTRAKRKDTRTLVDVYIKFTIDEQECKMWLQFTNVSCHDKQP